MKSQNGIYSITPLKKEKITSKQNFIIYMHNKIIKKNK